MKYFLSITIILFSVNLCGAAIIVDHYCTNLTTIPAQWITQAKSGLHIAYGHTSHGSQLTTGMSGLIAFKGDEYRWNTGGTGGALDLRDTPFSGASDLGNPNLTAWETATRNYLNAHAEVNVIIWSWCGQVSSSNQSDISNYLSLMSGLETDYPGVKFVYMTGHLDGSGLTGNLHLRNEQIRDYCRNNNKILYDFEDIESYNPDGIYFGDKIPNDNCDYDGNSDGTREGNWAIAWQNAHTQNVDWYDCSAAHSQPLNGNLKAYAAWWLWARLSGWQGVETDTTAPGNITTVRDGTGTTDIDSAALTTQLSANWTPSADSESGISGYSYAIGTSPGSANVADWAAIANVLTVTVTGLNLSAGTTYYFSVKAVNGAGLQSNATNSNGQFVTTSIYHNSPEITAYPNPYNLSGNTPLVFSGIHGTNTEIEIYTMSGKLIKKLSGIDRGSGINWDCKNEGGEKIVRGIYIYKMTASNGEKKAGKLAIVK
ncbi:MAG: hypothetical protein A2297_05615 [Elusimicrobia bacterium RIFOXYB2_FULL_48_7]|nr:MAG: hypothetical protein A2297_05615 [Elusimicrobia bacterium RIFOXYB2_FULL_48_7]